MCFFSRGGGACSVVRESGLAMVTREGIGEGEGGKRPELTTGSYYSGFVRAHTIPGRTRRDLHSGTWELVQNTKGGLGQDGVKLSGPVPAGESSLGPPAWSPGCGAPTTTSRHHGALNPKA